MWRQARCIAMVMYTGIGLCVYAQQTDQSSPGVAPHIAGAPVDRSPQEIPSLVQVPVSKQQAQQAAVTPAGTPQQVVINPASVNPAPAMTVVPTGLPQPSVAEAVTRVAQENQEAAQASQTESQQEAREESEKEQEIEDTREKEIEEKGEPETPAVPAVSQEIAQLPGAGTDAVPEEALPEIVGIDTVNVESASGNWLLKRIWFERAQEQYEKIKGLFDKVLELRLGFFTKRSELDRMMFEPFYLGIGIGQGELLEILSRLLQDLEEIRKESGALNAQENVLFETVEKEKATLEQLQKDVTSVTELDAALEAAIAQLIEQVNVCRGYEKQAWETFKEIGKQLSDKKARELYYAMDTYRKNSADIVNYLQRDFANYIRELERKAHEQIDRIMMTLKELKEKNIDFKQQAQRLEQKRHAKVEEVQEVEIEPQGVVGRIWSFIVSGVSTVWESAAAGVSGIYHWIWPFGSSQSQEEGDEA